ncbi:sensor domain-containing diguanylate cyclase [Parasphingorhabdus sp.]|uniref:sensor domain-containing diguanylate cyclase n=1 Tax=Parasphingorhabdus sp. TaxID=2709688 RepID=UPI003592F168
MRCKFSDDENGRIRALERLQVLDTPKEEPFEKIMSLVKQTLSVPICAVSLVDKERQWFKASRGLDVDETPRDISFCTHAIKSLAPYVVTDACVDPIFAENPLVTGGPKIRSYAGIPLTMSDGYNVGSLCAIDTVPRNFTDSEIAILSSFANIVVDELELRQLASKDALTGALNRRAWFEAANKEFERARRYSRPVSFLILDIDHFKSVNDQFGHSAGDEVLRHFSKTVSDELRQSDILGRYGGEEFVVALPDTGIANAKLLAERICEAVRNIRMEEINGNTCTVSIGVAERLPHEVAAETLVERADVALYQAKSDGRDKVICSDNRQDDFPRDAAA